MTTTAVAATAPGAVDAPSSFVVTDLELPAPGPHDLLVDVHAVSVNPVDVKVRAGFDAAQAPKVLGFDASGVVAAVGDAVSLFAVGDRVFYAGSIARPGSNAEQQLVDERIVGHAPTTLDHAEAAALPLTSITAWECLFDRLGIDEAATGTLLVVGGAGGVGSMVIQLARARTNLTVLATAGRPESDAWVREMGAHHVVDRHDLVASVRAVAPDGVDFVFSAFSAGNVETYAQVLVVGGAVVAIDDPQGLETFPLKDRAQSWRWESIFARPLYAPDDLGQHHLLDEVARLVDAGTVRTTLQQRLDGLTPENLREAHRQVESSATVGKVVVTVR